MPSATLLCCPRLAVAAAEAVLSLRLLVEVGVVVERAAQAVRVVRLPVWAVFPLRTLLPERRAARVPAARLLLSRRTTPSWVAAGAVGVLIHPLPVWVEAHSSAAVVAEQADTTMLRLRLSLLLLAATPTAIPLLAAALLVQAVPRPQPGLRV